MESLRNFESTSGYYEVAVGTKKKSGYFYVKRCMDFIFAIIALVVLSPLFLIVAIAIKFEDNGNVFYSQVRCGKNGKHFKMYKFRSMYMDADEKLEELQALNERDGPVFKISNDPRVTKVGSFIRKTCIDELPQLVNIIRGEMSIVGPRPPLLNEVEVYTPHDMQRLSVVPGLTCFWQVRKGEFTTFAEWVEMDIEYIEKQNLATDIKLVFLTFKVLFRRNGDE